MYRPHVTDVFGTEVFEYGGFRNGGFRIRSPDWIFLKTPAYRIRVDGRKRRFFFNTMTSEVGHTIKNACARMLCTEG